MKGFSFFFMTSVIVLFLLLIVQNYIKGLRKRLPKFCVHLSKKIILADPNLVRPFLGNIFFDHNYGAHPSN